MTNVFTRPLGRDGFQVPALTVGSWHTWDRTPFEETVNVIRAAVDAGASYFDVGVYSAMRPGQVGSPTDVIFGRAVQAAGVARDDYVLQVKSWVERSGSAEDIVAQFDQAVFRIGTDHAEIVVFGDLVGEHVPYEVIAEGAAALVASGRVRHWGVNNWSATEIRKVVAAAEKAGLVPPALAQLKYNVVRRSIAEGEPFRGVIADHGLKVQASDALEGGFLLGNPRRRPTGNDPGDIHGLVEEARPGLRALAGELGGHPGAALPGVRAHQRRPVLGRDRRAHDRADRGRPGGVSAAGAGRRRPAAGTAGPVLARQGPGGPGELMVVRAGRRPGEVRPDPPGRITAAGQSPGTGRTPCSVPGVLSARTQRTTSSSFAPKRTRCRPTTSSSPAIASASPSSRSPSCRT
ncbi:aldo/keto reductase [Spongiactinospora rosea]|uniref:aldo/keto reductase n=1 Tax=Spongiactinospora rosea TaxID=2248750 RepID=UPI0011C02DD7|nr:aldo/keto reductase [Spongiactinospora rosea]